MPAPAEAPIASAEIEIERATVYTTRRVRWIEDGKRAAAMAYALVAMPADIAARAIAKASPSCRTVPQRRTCNLCTAARMVFGGRICPTALTSTRRLQRLRRPSHEPRRLPLRPAPRACRRAARELEPRRRARGRARGLRSRPRRRGLGDRDLAQRRGGFLRSHERGRPVSPRSLDVLAARAAAEIALCGRSLYAGDDDDRALDMALAEHKDIGAAAAMLDEARRTAERIIADNLGNQD
jgi:hypothetical protein